MVNVVEIPLTPDPQVFAMVIGSINYKITLRWRDAQDGGWFIDIADFNDAPIIQGIPLVTGCNLLEQYGYLGIAGELRVQTDHNPDAVPTFDNLGITSHLYLVTP